MTNDEAKNVVSEILKEIEERMDGFESVWSSFGEGGLDEIHTTKECVVAYAVLDCLHTYISDSYDHNIVEHSKAD